MTDVQKLEGAELDLAVAKVAGIDAVLSDPHPNGSVSCVTFYGRGHDGRMNGRSYFPSAYWEDGGPIIEREEIELCRVEVMPSLWEYEATCRGFSAVHHKPLIAAMRAFVASRAAEIGLAGRGRDGGSDE